MRIWADDGTHEINLLGTGQEGGKSGKKASIKATRGAFGLSSSLIFPYIKLLFRLLGEV